MLGQWPFFFFSLWSLFLSKAPVLNFLFPSQNTVSPCSHPSLFWAPEFSGIPQFHRTSSLATPNDVQLTFVSLFGTAPNTPNPRTGVSTHTIQVGRPVVGVGALPQFPDSLKTEPWWWGVLSNSQVQLNTEQPAFSGKHNAGGTFWRGESLSHNSPNSNHWAGFTWSTGASVVLA